MNYEEDRKKRAEGLKRIQAVTEATLKGEKLSFDEILLEEAQELSTENRNDSTLSMLNRLNQLNQEMIVDNNLKPEDLGYTDLNPDLKIEVKKEEAKIEKIKENEELSKEASKYLKRRSFR